MDAVEERLAGLRDHAADAPDWIALEADVLRGLDRRRRNSRMQRHLGWTGALALAAGLAGGGAGGGAGGVTQRPWPAELPQAATAGPLALPAQAPSVVLMGAR